jgi:phytoene dehydrogenase-like protein
VSALDVARAMGRVGLPAPISELAARDWDAVVVGGGHNGLTAAAYLARAGRSVLVLERRDQLGGACTLERPFADQRYVVSPCAYVVGLLDQVVIDELDLARHGYRVTPADPNLWCPFPDGTSFAEFLDEERTATHMRANGFSERDIHGLLAYEGAFDRIRTLLRHGPGGDAWKGPSPNRAEIEARLGGDAELISIVFEESIADTLARYIDDERLLHALFGQGVIGAYAGPQTPGTAAVKLMHHQGDLLGLGSVWGYVAGGMGRVSFAIAQAALEAGAVLATGVPVAAIEPGAGVTLESGDEIRAHTVVSNADPKRTLAMLGTSDAVPEAYRDRLREWDVRSPVVKLNAALTRLPAFEAAGDVEPHRAMVTITDGMDAGQAAFEACERGATRIGFAELYFQTAYDETVAPPGRHLLSAFCQYAPYEVEGGWDARRDEVAGEILDAIAAYAPDIRDCVTEYELLGPADIEERIGLTGGSIFQGSPLPDQMWDRRLEARTPVEDLYLCGAATHPGGSVIALNGRNAPEAVLADTRKPAGIRPL